MTTTFKDLLTNVRKLNSDYAMYGEGKIKNDFLKICSPRVIGIETTPKIRGRYIYEIDNNVYEKYLNYVKEFKFKNAR